MSANSWPAVSGTTTGFTASQTTVMWGTDGVLQSPKPSSGFYIVTRVRQHRLAEKIPLGNGTGLTVNRIMLLDGVQWDITVRDDSSMTPPLVNGTLTLTDMAGMLGTVGAVYTAKIIEADYEGSPKNAGERVLVAENLVLIDSQTPGSAS